MSGARRPPSASGGAHPIRAQSSLVVGGPDDAVGAAPATPPDGLLPGAVVDDGAATTAGPRAASDAAAGPPPSGGSEGGPDAADDVASDGDAAVLVAPPRDKLPKRSLYLFTLDNPIRKAAIAINESRYFTMVTLLVIVVNSVFIAAADPLAGDDEGRNRWLSRADVYFLILFSLELLLRVVAMGFVMDKNSYLRDAWNWLDLIIVLMGWLPFIFRDAAGIDFSPVRTMRVLRPLKTIRNIKGMRILVISLLRALPLLVNAFALLIFVLVVFGLFGLALWRGLLSNSCFDRATGAFDDEHLVCSLFDSQGHQCDSDEVCRSRGENPNYGVTSFDHIGSAGLAVFQVITLEGWTDIQYYVMDGFSDWAVLYFVVLVIFGAFFVVNLALAVIYAKFAKVNEEVTSEEEMLEQAAKQQRKREEVIETLKNLVTKRAVVDNMAERKARASSGSRWARVDVRRVAAHGRQGTTGGQHAAAEPASTPEPSSTSIGAQLSATAAKYSQNVLTTSRTAWGRLRLASLRVVESDHFAYFVMGIIVVNTIIMATEHHEQADGFAFVQNLTNIIFTAIFAIELLLKLVALGPRKYVRDRFNIFDGLVVIISIVELSLGSSGGGVTVLRTFRLLRIFKLARSWGSLRKLLEIVIASMSSIFYCGLLLRLFSFVFSCMGMNFFGGWFDFDEVVFSGRSRNTRPRVPRANFDTFLWSVITVFQILTGEDWNTIMYDGVRARGWTAALFFVMLVLLGKYLLLNLFQAILLRNFAVSHVYVFEDDESENADGEDGEDEQAVLNDRQLRALANVPDGPDAADATAPNTPTAKGKGAEAMPGIEMSNLAKVGRVASAASVEEDGGDASGGSGTQRSRAPGTPTARRLTRTMTVGSDANQPKLTATRKIASSALSHRSGGSHPSTPGRGGGANALALLTARSCFIWSPESRFRRRIATLVFHRYFEAAVLVLIALSSLMLALDNPGIEQGSTMADVLFYADVVFAALFGTEMLLKIVALGFVLHKNAYLREPFNVLDFVVVLISCTSLILVSTSNVDIGFLRALRALRALRPLRVVSRFPGMRIVVLWLFRSIPAMVNVLLVCSLFWVIFAILGVQLFRGQFYFCTDPSVSGEDDCTAPAEWMNAPAHFDNFLAALLTLFEVGTLELWPQVMYSAVDARGVGKQPVRDSRPFASLYFVAFIVIGFFFALNLFVGVVIDNFNVLTREHTGMAFLTDTQRAWVAAQKTMMKYMPVYRPLPPKNRARLFVYRMVYTRTFEYVIMGTILLNLIFMGVEHEGMSSGVEDMLRIANYVFVGILVLELVAKVTAFGPRGYILDPWNRFDLFLVTVAIVGLIVGGSGGSVATVFRIFRIFRVLKLIRRARSVKLMFHTLYYSLPAMANIVSLLALIFFIYAVSGVSLLGKVKHQAYLNDHANFEHFGMALLTLFRMGTGESWNGIMHDAMVRPPDCEPELDNCGFSFIWIYFVSFMLILFIVLVNLFVAVILENFGNLVEEQEAFIGHADYETFVQTWSEFDHRATHFIPTYDLPAFVMACPPPLGLGGKASMAYARRVTMTFDIPEYSGNVAFRDVIRAMSSRKIGARLPSVELTTELERQWNRKFRTRGAKPLSTHLVRQYIAVMTIQHRWRAMVNRRRLARGEQPIPSRTAPAPAAEPPAFRMHEDDENEVLESKTPQTLHVPGMPPTPKQTLPPVGGQARVPLPPLPDSPDASSSSPVLAPISGPARGSVLPALRSAPVPAVSMPLPAVVPRP